MESVDLDHQPFSEKQLGYFYEDDFFEKLKEYSQQKNGAV